MKREKVKIPMSDGVLLDALVKTPEPCMCDLCESGRRLKRIRNGLIKRGFPKTAAVIEGLEERLINTEEELGMSRLYIRDLKAEKLPK